MSETEPTQDPSMETFSQPDLTTEGAETQLSPEAAARQVEAMTTLAEAAGKWGAEHPSESRYDQKTKTSEGMKFVDFKGFIAQREPNASEQDQEAKAALLQAEVTYYLHPDAFPAGPPTNESVVKQLSDGLVEKNANFEPTDVMRYSVHKIRETGGMPEGSDVAERIVAAVDQLSAAEGRNSTESHVLRTDILSTT